MSANGGFGGVTECYPFKSRLQEYAQKVSIPTPEYDTVMEGPSHEPVFRSTVTVNGTRYHSLPGFYNRKTAEQSAAEVALYEIHKSGQMDDSTPTVHETGLCKNLLQEYAQKMNYAMPSYVCNKQAASRTPYCCTVVVGGIHYIGAAAKTKKEAEIKAARTALLAIRTSCEYKADCGSVFTVVPGKRKGKDTEAKSEAANLMKPKKGKFKKKASKRKFAQNKCKKSRFNEYFRRTVDEEDILVMQGEEKMLGLDERHSRDSERSKMPLKTDESVDMIDTSLLGTVFQTKAVSESNGLKWKELEDAKGKNQNMRSFEYEANGRFQDGQAIESFSLPHDASDFEPSYFPGAGVKISAAVGFEADEDAHYIYGQQLRIDSSESAVNEHVLGVSSPVEVSEIIEDFGGPFQSNGFGW